MELKNNKQKKLLLIDGNSIIYRAFFALPYLETSNNLPTNAIYGFLITFIKIIESYEPDYICICFDTGAKTFREEKYKDYKSQRPETPKSLLTQLKIIKKSILEPLQVKYLEKDGFEADDLIATITHKIKGENVQIIIFSGDRDLLQLVSENNVIVIAPLKGISEVITFNENKVIEEYGVKPGQIIQYKAILGDVSDNIGGITGIGPKTAQKLINKYNNILNALTDDSKEVKKLVENKNQLLSNIDLITLNYDVSLDFSIEDLVFKGINEDVLLEISKTFEFRSLIKRKNENNIEIELSYLDDLNVILKEDVISIIIINSTTLEFTTKKESYLVKSDNNKSNLFGLNNNLIFDILSSKKILKIVFDLKSILHQINAPLDFEPDNIVDLKLAFFLLKPNIKNYSVEDFTYQFCSLSYDNGRNIFSSWENIKADLINRDLLNLFQDIEIPFANILYKMEKRGFRISKDKLFKIKTKVECEINEIQKKIFDYAGIEFNISSPKELGQILFEKFQFPLKKKTKTGYSTDADVLGELINIHPVISCIIKYRELKKLFNSYILPFIDLTREESYIHTDFVQTGTSTGRISSINPNLQNLPAESELDEDIKTVFIPRVETNILLSADYSQIDLRVLAHFSNDSTLKDAFINDIDIHNLTAIKIFNLSNNDSITLGMRRVAKTINFGIIYGMSSFGLSQSLKISEYEAQNFINKYFIQFKGVKDYIDDVIEDGKKKGYSKTILGRIRQIPEIKSDNRTTQQLGERLIINSIIQGSSADIIKIAMIKLNNRLKEHKSAFLVLQVHDELVFDIPKVDLENISNIVKEEMENINNPFNKEKLLSVPLRISIKRGNSMGDLT